MPRRDFTKVPFAATGDVTSIPTAVQPDGSVSMASGFGFDYQRDNGAGGGTPDPLAKSIPRDATNGILNEITASIGEIQQNGYPAWALSAAPYPVNAMVRHNDRNWRSAITNNSAAPGSDATSWLDPMKEESGMVLISSAGLTNWSVPDVLQRGIKMAKVTLIGGGGGGGGAGSSANYNSAAGGGGGGGGCIKRIDLSGVLTVAVTIGAGGNGGNNGATPGSAGGSSSFGTFISATGGAGGTQANGTIITGSSATSRGGDGGLGSGGDINSRGGNGGVALSAAPTSTLASVLGGAGGGTLLSGGGNDFPAILGAGGPGGATSGGSMAGPGRVGSAGCCLIEW